MILQLRRWLPGRPLVLAGDSGYAVLDLLHFCQSLREPVTLITRLRLDAGLYAPAPPRRPGQNGRPRVKGARLPTLKELLNQSALSWITAPVAWYGGSTRIVELASQTAVWYHSGKPPVPIRWVLVRDPQGEFDTQALLCTNSEVAPAQILEWFALRWQLEVTLQEVRAHLGVETQRQWSGRAIARTTPVLMGLFSWTTLAAHPLQKRGPITQRKAAWYNKPAQLSSMPLPWCAATCGLPRRVFQRRRDAPTMKKSPTQYTPGFWTRWPTLLECAKSRQEGKAKTLPDAVRRGALLSRQVTRCARLK